ncbi:MAG: helix-turn-helix domain-containing protein [Elusimicrobia bacterium]|nr:helix-turn-helix domain-containing protein [Elusimicrobiota bacterium]
MSFGTRLKELRRQRNLSLRELGGKLQVDHAYLSRLETGSVFPSEKVIRQIARTFKLSVEELSLAAGKLPNDVATIFYEHPKEAAFLLRERFAVYNTTVQLKGKKENGHRQELEPIFQTRRGQLYQCDCLEFLPTVPDGSADLVFADPPFNLRKNYGQLVDDDLQEEKYLQWSYQWLEELCRILKPGGSLFVYNLPKWNIHFAALLARSLTFRHWIAINIKTTLPIPGRLYPSHYSLLYFTKGKPRVFNRPRVPIPSCRHCGGDIKDYGGHRKWLNPAGLNLTDVWDDIPPVRHQKYKSRAANELSVKLLQRVLEIASEKEDLVFDPFGGGGTTYYAAELMERRWLGCEIEDCKPIIERLSGNLFTNGKLTTATC